MNCNVIPGSVCHASQVQGKYRSVLFVRLFLLVIYRYYFSAVYGNYVVTMLPSGPADIILCDSHFSWKHQKTPKSSDDITDDVPRSWSLSDISLTILPVSSCVVLYSKFFYYLCFIVGSVCWRDW